MARPSQGTNVMMKRYAEPSLITPRGRITLLLLAALGLVVLVGVANWREAVQADPAPSVRAQLGRSAHARALGVRQAESAEAEPGSAASQPSYQASRATANGAPLRPYAASLDARPVRAHGMRIAREADASGRTRWPETAPFGRGSTQAAAVPTSALTSAVEISAIVEFIAVMQDEKLLKQGAFGADFVRDLKIIVWWNVTGTNTQRLELFTPNGALYKQFTAEFDADATRVQPSGRAPVETRLPVSGTWITEYSLLGAWRVDVYLGSQRTPTTSASFVLNR
jgi:hypothetical protein